MDEALLVAENLGKKFFRKSRESAAYVDVVAGVDLALQRGQLVALRGRSGGGKSTLLNMLAGLLEPSEGRVVLDGTDLYQLDDVALSKLRNRRIGVIPQGQTALHSLTVLENVLLPYQMHGNAQGGEERAMELLGSLDIGGLADAYPNELSGGEMRRMAIARALMCEPDVLLADEPTGDLDDENTANVLAMLRAYAQGGAAVLLVTHEQEATSYADRMLRMSSGVLSEE